MRLPPIEWFLLGQAYLLTPLFTAKTLLTPVERIEQPFVLVGDGCIVELGSRVSRETPVANSTVDFSEFTLGPGLIDMHMHGGAGRDVMEADADALPAVEKLLAAHGVTSYFPTTVTAPIDKTLAALERLADAIEGVHDCSRARPVGIH